MELIEPAVKKKAPTRRGTTHGRCASLTEDLRANLKLVQSIAADMPDATREFDKLLKSAQKLIEKDHLRERQKKDDEEWERKYFNTKFGGRIERFIRELPEKEVDETPIPDNIRAKAHFRAKGWRT
jgi:hypothetical protein